VLVLVASRFQLWVDECSKLFGGLDIAAVKAIRARDGTEYIVEVTCPQSINQSIKIYFLSNKNITVYTVYASAQKAAREAYAH